MTRIASPAAADLIAQVPTHAAIPSIGGYGALAGPTSAEELDVLVVGGSQAGLATGAYLAQLGCRFRIMDAGARIGDTSR